MLLSQTVREIDDRDRVLDAAQELVAEFSREFGVDLDQLRWEMGCAFEITVEHEKFDTFARDNMWQWRYRQKTPARDNIVAGVQGELDKETPSGEAWLIGPDGFTVVLRLSDERVEKLENPVMIPEGDE